MATVVFLVTLRLLIGAMFYWGAIHKRDATPPFSSVGFMQRATGPLAPLYKAQVPDYYGWRTNIEAPRKAEPGKAARDVDRLDRKSDAWNEARTRLIADKATAYQDWEALVEAGWWEAHQRVVKHYDFDEKQQKKSRQVAEIYVAKLKNHLVASADDIIAYRHNLYQDGYLPPGPDLPAAAEAAKIKSAALGVRAWVEGAEQDLIRDLSLLATQEQRDLGSLPVETATIDRVDKIVIYSHMLIGVCLLAGLFTRLAFFGAGTFILTVVATQPPWVADAAPWLWGPQAVGYQACIMLVCFALMFSHVGRWAGLDFFVHKLIGCRCCGGKGEA